MLIKVCLYAPYRKKRICSPFRMVSTKDILYLHFYYLALECAINVKQNQGTHQLLINADDVNYWESVKTGTETNAIIIDYTFLPCQQNVGQYTT